MGQPIDPRILKFRSDVIDDPKERAKLQRELKEAEAENNLGVFSKGDLSTAGNLQKVNLSNFRLSVEDADTLILQRRGLSGIGSAPIQIRLSGIDAPEISGHSGDPLETVRINEDQPFGREAAKGFQSLIAGQKNLQLLIDPSQQTYGRYLGFLEGDKGLNLNIQAVREGLATALPFGEESEELISRQTLASAEREARSSRAGLWKLSRYQALEIAKEKTGQAITHNTLTRIDKLAQNLNLGAYESFLESFGSATKPLTESQQDTAARMGYVLRKTQGFGKRSYNQKEGIHPGSQGMGAESVRSHSEFGSGYNAALAAFRAAKDVLAQNPKNIREFGERFLEKTSKGAIKYVNPKSTRDFLTPVQKWMSTEYPKIGIDQSQINSIMDIFYKRSGCMIPLGEIEKCLNSPFLGSKESNIFKFNSESHSAVIDLSTKEITKMAKRIVGSGHAESTREAVGLLGMSIVPHEFFESVQSAKIDPKGLSDSLKFSSHASKQVIRDEAALGYMMGDDVFTATKGMRSAETSSIPSLTKEQLVEYARSIRSNRALAKKGLLPEHTKISKIEEEISLIKKPEWKDIEKLPQFKSRYEEYEKFHIPTGSSDEEFRTALNARSELYSKLSGEVDKKYNEVLEDYYATIKPLRERQNILRNEILKKTSWDSFKSRSYKYHVSRIYDEVPKGIDEQLSAEGLRRLTRKDYEFLITNPIKGQKFSAMPNSGTFAAETREQLTEFKKDFASRWDPLRKIAKEVFGDTEDAFARLTNSEQFKKAISTGLKGSGKKIGIGAQAETWVYKTSMDLGGKSHEFEFVVKRAGPSSATTPSALFRQQESFARTMRDEARSLQELGSTRAPSYYGHTRDFGLNEEGVIMEKFNLGEGVKKRKLNEVEYGDLRDFMKSAHVKGITHTDLHSENVVRAFTPEGKSEVAVLDWGLANRFLENSGIGGGQEAMMLTGGASILRKGIQKRVGRPVGSQEFSEVADMLRVEQHREKGNVSKSSPLVVNSIYEHFNATRRLVESEDELLRLKSSRVSTALMKDAEDELKSAQDLLSRRNDLINSVADDVSNFILNKQKPKPSFKYGEFDFSSGQISKSSSYGEFDFPSKQISDTTKGAPRIPSTSPSVSPYSKTTDARSQFAATHQMVQDSTRQAIKRNRKFAENSKQSVGIGLRSAHRATKGHMDYSSTKR